jgi:hypothetical protein
LFNGEQRFANRGYTVHSIIELKENTVIVVLGASGDLAKKKTVRTSKTSASIYIANPAVIQFPALFGLVSIPGSCGALFYQFTDKRIASKQFPA